jgi:hypothetical protein
MKSNFTKLNDKGKAAPPKAKKVAGVLQVLEVRPSLIWDPRETESMTHAQAEQYIKDLNAKEPGKNWRLPTVDELFALADRTKHNPAIDKNFFPKCKSDWYWTSTPAAYSPADYAWVVSFDNGSAHWARRGYRAYVRAVRPSQ